MFLFSEEKEVIFKITNSILLIWLVIAIVVFSSSVISLIVKQPTYTEEEYIALNCIGLPEEKDISTDPSDSQCAMNYTSYLVNNKNDEYYKKISLYTSLANIIIVAGAMIILNRKKTI